MDKETADRIAQALIDAAPLVAKREKFLADLREEKGDTHAAFGRVVMRLAGAVGMMAAINVGIDIGAPGLDTEDGRKKAFNSVAGLLNDAVTELGRGLGISDQDIVGIGRAAIAFTDSIVKAAPASTS